MINKNGNIQKENIYESGGMNQLEGTRYTFDNPYVLTGTGNDIYSALNNQCEVIPGQTYYLCAKCDKEWSTKHGLSDTSKWKATIWLYLLANRNINDYGYDNPILFTSGASNNISTGVWKYTIPADRHQARIRVNTYSDGTQISVKFWDIALIPEKYYVGSTPPPQNSSLHIDKTSITAREITEY